MGRRDEDLLKGQNVSAPSASDREAPALAGASCFWARAEETKRYKSPGFRFNPASIPATNLRKSSRTRWISCSLLKAPVNLHAGAFFVPSVGQLTEPKKRKARLDRLHAMSPRAMRLHRPRRSIHFRPRRRIAIRLLKVPSRRRWADDFLASSCRAIVQ